MGDVDYLYEPEGSELHWEGLQKKAQPAVQQASFSGPTPKYSHPADRPGLAGTSAAHADSYMKPSAPTPEELLKHANAMIDMHAASNQALLDAGPATGDRNDAGGKIPEWLTSEMRKDGNVDL